ncbi:hypothetical protein [Amycolatopsis dendrobii]|uniref:Uncharacterized protein n=1 Tax=Amycolatopsis dendrobii TaxID=2760662 RepID=A0A7W3ZAA6_9PSEU|nr:hypothetical protein [Amycolatopsis dendrobii]MBB1153478.1 hypothetical protein [Amycolatopsis dendrobii]
MADEDSGRFRVVVELDGDQISVTLHASKAWKERFQVASPESRRNFAEGARDAAYKALTDTLHGLSFSGDTSKVRTIRS